MDPPRLRSYVCDRGQALEPLRAAPATANVQVATLLHNNYTSSVILEGRRDKQGPAMAICFR